MALWQFDLALLPFIKASPIPIFDKLMEFTPYWKDFKESPKLIDRLSILLPEGESYSNDMLAWGNHESNMIKVFVEHGRIVELSIRIDVRNFHKEFVLDIAKLCSEFSLCMYVVEKQVFIQGNGLILLDVIGKSRAASFVDDPVGFIEKLADMRSGLGG